MYGLTKGKDKVRVTYIAQTVGHLCGETRIKTQITIRITWSVRTRCGKTRISIRIRNSSQQNAKLESLEQFQH